MARLSAEFVRAVRTSNFQVGDLCKQADIDYQMFCHFMPIKRYTRRALRGRHRIIKRGRVGEPSKKIPRARWSKTRLKILKMASILGVDPAHVFIEDD